MTNAETALRASDRRWRVFLIALALFTLALTPIDVWEKFNISGHEPDAFNAPTEGTGVPFVLRVTGSSHGSALENGDIIDLRPLSPEARYRFETQLWVAGERIEIPVSHGHRSTVVTTRAIKNSGRSRLELTPHAVAFWLAIIALVLIPLFAIMLSIKRPRSLEIRMLAFLLIFQALRVPSSSYNWLTPWLWLDVTMDSISNAAGALFFVCLALYATMFGRPVSPLRRVLCVATILLAVVNGGLHEAATVLNLGTAIDLNQLSPLIWQWTFALPTGAALFGIVGAARSAMGAERARAIWASASLAPILCGDLIANIFGPILPISEEVYSIAGNVSGFLLLFGLSYALFNRRLLDVGFALNRATVFAALSLLVFGAFNLTEWALGGWLSTLNRTTNAAISATLALALGLSLKPLHDGVERIVDGILFRKRHESERALRTFAHEAVFFTQAATLIEAMKSTLAEHAEARTVALILDRDGSFGDLDPDDACLVALRAWHRRIDLHTLRSSLNGEYAFPLIVRGKLTGVMSIGPKRSAEPYAPDELDAMDRIALAVGIALDGLERAPEPANDEAITLIRSIQATVSALADRILMPTSSLDPHAGRTQVAEATTGGDAVPITYE